MAQATITRDAVTIYSYEDNGIFVVEAHDPCGRILTAENTTDAVAAFDAILVLAERHPQHFLKAGVRP
jgi:hypothetical protein